MYRACYLVVGLLVILLMTGCISQADELNVNSMPMSFPPTRIVRPNYILAVSPLEDSEISLDDYQAEWEGIIVTIPQSDKKNSTVCVQFDVANLVEDGDEFTHSEIVIEHVMMKVDNEILSKIVHGNQVITLHQAKSTNDEVLISWSGPFDYCWHADIGIGSHEATFEFEQTSGQKRSYSWEFLLTES